MSRPSNRREIRVPLELKERVKELAYQQRRSASSVVGEVVAEFAALPVHPRKPSGKPTENLRFTSPDEVWDQALAKAEAEGASLAQAIRDGLENKTADISV